MAGIMDRSKKEDSTGGKLIMTLGRLADPYLQYTLLTNATAVKLITKLGLRAANPLALTTGAGIGKLGPIPSLLVGLYTVSALRHVYWANFTLDYKFQPAAGLFVAFFNTTLNTVNTLVLAHQVTNYVSFVQQAATANTLRSFLDSLGPIQYLGTALFALGIYIELKSESDRDAFKADPANKGKLYTRGWASVVRQPNYLGYLLWRVGTTLATGSWIAAAAVGVVQTLFFTGAIVDQNNHMRSKYGAAWAQYEKQTPYKLIPYVY